MRPFIHFVRGYDINKVSSVKKSQLAYYIQMYKVKSIEKSKRRYKLLHY